MLLGMRKLYRLRLRAMSRKIASRKRKGRRREMDWFKIAAQLGTFLAGLAAFLNALAHLLH